MSLRGINVYYTDTNDRLIGVEVDDIDYQGGVLEYFNIVKAWDESTGSPVPLKEVDDDTVSEAVLVEAKS